MTDEAIYLLYAHLQLVRGLWLKLCLRTLEVKVQKKWWWLDLSAIQFRTLAAAFSPLFANIPKCSNTASLNFHQQHPPHPPHPHSEKTHQLFRRSWGQHSNMLQEERSTLQYTLLHMSGSLHHRTRTGPGPGPVTRSHRDETRPYLAELWKWQIMTSPRNPTKQTTQKPPDAVWLDVVRTYRKFLSSDEAAC